MKNSSFLKALSLSVAALALNVGAAHASTGNNGIVAIYGGGSTLSYNVIDILGQCAGQQNSAGSADKNTAAAIAAGCTTAANGAYEYLFAGIGSGAGMHNLVNSSSSNTASSDGNGNHLDANNGFGTYPYPSWQLTTSDAPLNTVDAPAFPGTNPITSTPFTNSSYQSYVNSSNVLMFLDEYNAAYGSKTYTPQSGSQSGTLVAGGGGRGAAWQIPVLAVPIALPYNLPTTSFVANNVSGASTTYAGVSFGVTPPAPLVAPGATASVSNSLGTTVIAGPATVSVLQLSTDQICYIWTKANAKGKAVTGNYTWDNPIFTGSVTAAGSIVQYDSNIVPSSVAGLPIHPIRRLDASGTTYLFTLWLKNNCKGYTAAGYSTPAVYVSWPSYVTAANASGGGAMVSSTNLIPGGIGYVTPDNVAPTSGKTVPAAFVLAPEAVFTHTSQFVYPGTAGVIAAESGVPLPASVSQTNTAQWGTALNKKFFASAAANGGYAITGLTYLMGYSCYTGNQGNDEYTGVKNYIQQLSTPAAQSVMVSKGFAPLTSDQYTAETNAVLTQLTSVVTGPLQQLATVTPPKAANATWNGSYPFTYEDSYVNPNNNKKVPNGKYIEVDGPKTCPKFAATPSFAN